MLRLPEASRGRLRPAHPRKTNPPATVLGGAVNGFLIRALCGRRGRKLSEWPGTSSVLDGNQAQILKRVR